MLTHRVNRISPLPDGADNAPAIAEALLEANQSDGVLQLAAGTYRCTTDVFIPVMNNVLMTGMGQDRSVLSFAAGKGIVYDKATRITNCGIEKLSLHCTGGGGTAIRVHDWDRGYFKQIRINASRDTGWVNGLEILSMTDRGALHNVIEHCTVTNCSGIGIHLGGAQGPNETRIQYCYIGANAVGLQVGAPTSGVLSEHCSFESNKVAVRSDGKKGHFATPRMEGNEIDFYFGAQSGENIVDYAYFNPAKYVNLGGVTNRVRGYAFELTRTEAQEPIFVPIDPMAIELKPITPGANVAVSHRFAIGDEAYALSSVSFAPSVRSGKVCAAICEASGKIISVTAPVDVGTAGKSQELRLPETILLGLRRSYHVVLQFDSPGTGFYGTVAANAGFQLGQKSVLARQKAMKEFPLKVTDNPVSGASGTTKTLYAVLG